MNGLFAPGNLYTPHHGRCMGLVLGVTIDPSGDVYVLRTLKTNEGLSWLGTVNARCLGEPTIVCQDCEARQP